MRIRIGLRSRIEARSRLDVRAVEGAGLAGGDRLDLNVEAAPERNLLNMEARLQAPANGFLAGMTGIARPIEAAIGGRGDWANWQGRIQAVTAGQSFADLQLGARNGTFTSNAKVRARAEKLMPWVPLATVIAYALIIFLAQMQGLDFLGEMAKILF